MKVFVYLYSAQSSLSIFVQKYLLRLTLSYKINIFAFTKIVVECGTKIHRDDCALSKGLGIFTPLPVFGSGLDICPFDYYLFILQYHIEHS